MSLEFIKGEELSTTEVTEAIMEAVGKKNDPIKVVVEAYLSTWKSQIQYNQLKEDEAMVEKVFNDNKTKQDEKS